jgi:hypothetical protein
VRGDIGTRGEPAGRTYVVPLPPFGWSQQIDIVGGFELKAVMMMNIEIGRPTDYARAIGWVWFHTPPGTSWAVGGRFDDTYIKGRKMGLARIIAPRAS